jgi:hypothetical protein
MGKKIAFGFLAATLYAAPLEAEPANPMAPAITKPNNDATLRGPHYSLPPAPPPHHSNNRIRSNWSAAPVR